MIVKNKSFLVTQILINTILMVFGALTILPFLYMFTTSLLNDVTSLGNAIYLIPRQFHFENYITGWNYIRMGPAYLNTLIVTIGSGVLHLAITTAAAFPLSRHRFPGRNTIKYVFLGTLFIPSQVILVPTLVVLKSMGLMGRLSGVILPAVCDAFAIFVFVGFFKGIPRELEESAKMDGCSELKILLNIYIPLSLAPMATIALFHFLGVWNDVVLPALVLSVAGTLDKLTLSPLMTLFLNTQGVPMTKFLAPAPNIKAAVIIMNITPILILYGFLQRFFRSGISLGALKG
ncbi:MAG: carbohydrate ABC transporter permease [Spirochaetota bacterium]